MGKYLKLFETHSQYTAFTQTEDFILPNVSYCKDQTDIVHYNPIVPPQETRLMVTYNVEDANSPTPLYFYYVAQEEGAPSALGVNMFDNVEIDGTEVSITDIDSASGAYQLSSGEHTIAYTLKDPTFIGLEVDEQTGMPSKVGAMFMECAAITNAEIPNSVTTIGDSAFTNCDGLTSVTIPDSVTTISDGAFDSCSSLTSVTIPDSVTTIGSNAFTNCSGLEIMIVENGNTVYDSRDNCNAIIETASNTLISGCKNTIIPNSVTSIGDGAFANCTSLTSITIPNSVTSIGDGAFANCTSLTSITIPNSVTSIGSSVFNRCRNLVSVNIPNSVTYIGNHSFQYTNLYEVTIPSSVTSIDLAAFNSCTNLASVTIQATTPPTLGNYVFEYTNNCPIYVPSGSVDAYKTATNWGAYASRIQAIP